MCCFAAGYLPLTPLRKIPHLTDLFLLRSEPRWPARCSWPFPGTASWHLLWFLLWLLSSLTTSLWKDLWAHPQLNNSCHKGRDFVLPCDPEKQAFKIFAEWSRKKVKKNARYCYEKRSAKLGQQPSMASALPRLELCCLSYPGAQCGRQGCPPAMRRPTLNSGEEATEASRKGSEVAAAEHVP